jgi:hypothetical protein
LWWENYDKRIVLTDIIIWVEKTINLFNHVCCTQPLQKEKNLKVLQFQEKQMKGSQAVQTM